MRPLRDVSIREKFVLLVTGVSLLALGSTFGLFTLIELSSERTRALEEFTGLADFMGVQARASLVFEDEAFARESLAGLKINEDVSAAYLLRPDQSILAGYRRDPEAAGSLKGTAREPFESLGADCREDLHRSGRCFSENFLHLVRPVFLDREQVGWVFLRAELSDMKEEIVGHLETILACLLLSLFLAYLFSRRLQDHIFQPVTTLVRTMEKVAREEDFSCRVGPKRGDELGKLMAGFNHMLEQIEARDRRLEEANRELEERVSRRTRDLSRTNADLRREIAERLQAEKALQKSEAKFRLLFERSPISLWEEDISEVLDHLARLRQKGVEDFHSYFDRHPEEVHTCVGKVKILDVNQRSVEKFKAADKQDLLTNLHQVFTDKTYPAFKEMLVAMAAGRTHFETEAVNRTLKGEERVFSTRFSIFPDEEYDKAVVSLVDITDIKRAERALVSAKARLEHLLTSTPAGIYTARASGEGVTFISDNVPNMLGYTSDQFIDDPGFWSDRLHPEDRVRILAEVPKGLARGHHLHEYRFRKSDGTYRWLLDEFRLVRDDRGAPLEIVGYWIDITPRKEAEERLLASLAEKEVLLQEVHHRVKNNLQVIASLLNLQRTKADREETREELLIARNRIRSMAIIHESLYASEDLSQVDFSQHVRRFSARLLSLHEVENVVVSFDLDEFSLDVGAAIPCSLIINELLTNALKHAFPGGREGTVTIGLAREGPWHLLSVRDDGVGIPAAIDPGRIDSLGLHLVASLVGQLNGSMTIDRYRGTRVAIKFKVA